jgi:hypothetical protein
MTLPLYFSLNFILSALTSFFLIRMVLKKKYLLVRPSIWFLVFFNVQIQWSTVVNANYIYENLHSTRAILLLTQVFPLVTLLVVMRLFVPATIKTWEKVVDSSRRDYTKSYTTLLVIFVPVCLAILFVYLIYVPFTKTGLYFIVVGSDALAASFARENSLKLLPNEWLKYAYQFYSRFLAVFVASILTIIAINLFRKRKTFFIPLLLLSVFIILIGASLPGARGTGAKIILSLFLTFFLQNRLRIKGVWLVLGFFAVLMPSVFIQLLKYDAGFGFWQIFEGFNVLLERVMFVPLKSGIQWLSYTDLYGFWGVQGIPKLAVFLGKEPVNVPNFLMNYYTTSVIDSGFLTTSFVFSYYCFFGLLVIPVYVFLIIFIDFWVFLYARLATPLVVPAIVSLNAASINLIGSDYLTMFLTYGFLTGAIFIALTSSLLVGRKRVHIKFRKSFY